MPKTPSPTPSEGEEHSTLYPKITAKLQDTLEELCTYPAAQDKPIPFTGTVKLHGTHADILFDRNHLTYQSRNRINLSPKADNQGFAAFCTEREGSIRTLLEDVELRWRGVHNAEILEGSIMLAGEWIGQGIQKGVAISALSRRWVICSIQINGMWEAMERYADISNEEIGIFNINHGGVYRLELGVEDRGAAFMEAARKLTEEVTASCPFGRALEVEGKGEGIVWVPAEDAEVPNLPELWLKTKGEDFAVSSYKPKILPEQGDVKVRAKVFAEANCTEVRLDQGLQYLDEMGIEKSRKGLGEFLKWLTRDIEKEEKREIEELALGGAWKAEASKIARPWFEKRIQEI